MTDRKKKKIITQHSLKREIYWELVRVRRLLDGQKLDNVRVIRRRAEDKLEYEVDLKAHAEAEGELEVELDLAAARTKAAQSVCTKLDERIAKLEKKLRDRERAFAAILTKVALDFDEYDTGNDTECNCSRYRNEPSESVQNWQCVEHGAVWR